MREMNVAILARRRMPTNMMIFCAFVVAFSSCAKGVDGPLLPLTISGPARLYAGDSANLAATVTDPNGSSRTISGVTWQTSAPAVAAVTAAGLIRALSSGTAEVTAAASGTTVGRLTVVIVAGVVTVVGPPRLLFGDTGVISAVVRDSAGTPLPGRTVVWQSSAPAVATVSSSGTLSTVGLGAAEITATVAGATGRHTLRVVAPTSVKISGIPYLATGDSSILVATAFDSAGAVISGRPVVWQSSAPSVATISPLGRMTAVGLGSAEISATIAGATGKLSGSVLNLVTNESWTGSNGWTLGGSPGGLTTLVSRQDSPFPDKMVVQYLWPIGSAGAASDPTRPGPPSTNWDFAPSARPTEIFIGVSIKIDSPYQVNASLVQKFLYVQDTDNAFRAMWLEFYGTPGPGASVSLVNQMIPSGPRYNPNVTYTALDVGSWHRYEMYFKLSSSAASNDGVVKVWVDGILNINKTDVPTVGADRVRISTTHQNMQWGGTSEPKTEVDRIWATHNRILAR